MDAIAINGDVWRVVRVSPCDPLLVDESGTCRLGMTVPSDLTIAISSALVPPLLDRVLLHEMGHAVTVSWGLLPDMRQKALRGDLRGLEEWSAQLIENHAIEAVMAASEALGRPVCVMGTCMGAWMGYTGATSETV